MPKDGDQVVTHCPTCKKDTVHVYHKGMFIDKWVCVSCGRTHHHLNYG